MPPRKPDEELVTEGLNKEELILAALKLHIQKTQHEITEGRSWIRQPNNFISAVAIVMTLLSVGYQLRKDHRDDIDKDLASLSAVVTDLTKLDTELLTATITDHQALANLSIAVTNRRQALLTEADRLIKSLGDRAPHAQLAALGPEYFQVNDYATALKYFMLETNPPSSSVQQISAWRSIAIVYYNEGPETFDKARDAFVKAVAIAPDPKDVGLVGVELSVQEEWAQFELASRNADSAAQHYRSARLLANRFPCVPDRIPTVMRIGAESKAVVDELRKLDAAKADTAQREWDQATGADHCPNSAMGQTVLPIGGDVSNGPVTRAVAPVGVAAPPLVPNQVGLTSVCEFLLGPKKGTRYDFALNGWRPVAVGTACNDGAQSYGYTVLVR